MAAEAPLLLFDLDNTLVDRDGAFRRYLADFLTRHAAPFAQQDPHGVEREIIALDAHGRTPRAQFFTALLQRYPALPHTPESLWQDLQRILDHFVHNAEVIPMLQRLAPRFRMGLISNGSGPMQRRKLHDAGLAPFFSHVWISGEEDVAKPDPEIFRRALSFFHADSATMIGDDPHNDIRPAHALGLTTVHIVLPGDAPDALADHAITDILQLEEILSCTT